MQKIMFNDQHCLTDAVLCGDKTMTRRIVPKCRALDILRLWEKNEGAIATGYEEKTQSFRFDYCPDKKRRISIDHLNLYPKYKVGEVIAVAQSYKDAGVEWDLRSDESLVGCAGWNNKMFVGACLMPHRIRITDIRVERLQDISEEDCLREGIKEESSFPHKKSCPFYFDGGKHGWDNHFSTPHEAFAALIDKVSGKGTWESNPYVWVYSFQLIK